MTTTETKKTRVSFKAVFMSTSKRFSSVHEFVNTKSFMAFSVFGMKDTTVRSEIAKGPYNATAKVTVSGYFIFGMSDLKTMLGEKPDARLPDFYEEASDGLMAEYALRALRSKIGSRKLSHLEYNVCVYNEDPDDEE
jgi:hypothetical protein